MPFNEYKKLEKNVINSTKIKPRYLFQRVRFYWTIKYLKRNGSIK